MFRKYKILALGLVLGFGQIELDAKDKVYNLDKYLIDQAGTMPIVFHSDYDISLFGIEKLHPFDTKKYGKIAKHIQKVFKKSPKDFYKPTQVTDQDLSFVHSKDYLESLKLSYVVAKVAEVPSLKYLPNFLLQRNLLNGMRKATAGTVLGAQLAMQQGWAINLAGGYHHAKTHNGEGFCFFADIPLAVSSLFAQNPDLKILIVDLDAHQGNGLESIMGAHEQVYIFDMYSQNNYPMDSAVYQYIDFNHPLPNWINDEAYLEILKTNLPQAIAQVKPDLIIYNAGSDPFEKDKLGRMSITKAGMIERDLFVWQQALGSNTPILMVLSGGYSPESAEIVGESIENIIKQFTLLGE